MIQWTEDFARWRRPLGWCRLMRARARWSDVDRYRLINLWGRGRHRRCFVIGNGPSLRGMDLSVLRDEITIGSNGIYRKFRPTYLLAMDTPQTERRAGELARIARGCGAKGEIASSLNPAPRNDKALDPAPRNDKGGPMVLASLKTAYAFPLGCGVTFVRTRVSDAIFAGALRPMFSLDFPEVVYTGGTVTYVGLQLAWWLGCEEMYLIGVDHDYGGLELPRPCGRVRLTREDAEALRGRHFTDDYWRAGSLMNLPEVGKMTEAYAHARAVLESLGRRVMNATVGGKLEVFPRVKYEELF